MTYEENLRKTAEEIARHTHPDGWDSGFSEKGLVVRYLPAAEYCLKKQADAYREAIGSFYDGDPNLKILEAKLKAIGLIP